MEQEQLKSDGFCYAVTLTYKDEYVPYDAETGLSVSKDDLTLFLKRVRNYITRQALPLDYTGKRVLFEGKTRFKYYAVGEYGELRYRPHYHIIFFGVNTINAEAFANLVDFAWSDENRISKGIIYVDELSTKAIRYCCGYIVENRKKSNQAFSLISKGIGEGYLTLSNQKYHKQNLNRYGKKQNGVHVRLPRYYTNKIFSIKDNEKLMNKGLKYFQELTDEEVMSKVQSNINLSETKKRQLSTNSKFKKL